MVIEIVVTKRDDQLLRLGKEEREKQKPSDDQVLKLGKEEREKQKLNIDQDKGIKYVFVLALKTP